MVCHYSAAGIYGHRGNGGSCAAKAMQPQQRQDLAVQALAGTETIRGLAAQHVVSRKFVYQQANKARRALDDAFVSACADDEVLFEVRRFAS